MKISAINGFRSGVTFEKKPNKESIVVSRPQTSSLKAIPLAVMLAMSPLNAVQAQNKADVSSKPKIEQLMKMAEKDKLMMSLDYKEACNFLTGCQVQLYSLDGGNTYNRFMLDFEPNAVNKKDLEKHKIPKDLSCEVQINLKLDTLKKVTTYFDDGEDRWIFSNRYYAVGPAIKKYMNFMNATSYELIPNSSDFHFEEQTENEEVSITEDFYNDLKAIFNDAVKYSNVEINEKVKTDYYNDDYLRYLY